MIFGQNMIEKNLEENVNPRPLIKDEGIILPKSILIPYNLCPHEIPVKTEWDGKDSPSKYVENH